MIRDALRHADIKMTSRYVNASADLVRQLSDRVADNLAAALVGGAVKPAPSHKTGDGET